MHATLPRLETSHFPAIRRKRLDTSKFKAPKTGGQLDLF